jgi:hypothetical protein
MPTTPYPGAVPDVHYDFTQFGLDRSQSTFDNSLGTSLIIDPPDGRTLPMIEERVRRNAVLTAS